MCFRTASLDTFHQANSFGMSPSAQPCSPGLFEQRVLGLVVKILQLWIIHHVCLPAKAMIDLWY